MRHIVTASDYLMQRIRGQVATGRAEESVVVAEFHAPDSFDLEAATARFIEVFNREADYLAIEDAIFEEPMLAARVDDAFFAGSFILGEDQGVEPSRWPHVDRNNMELAECYIDEGVPADAVIDALDIMEVWNAPCD